MGVSFKFFALDINFIYTFIYTFIFLMAVLEIKFIMKLIQVEVKNEEPQFYKLWFF